MAIGGFTGRDPAPSLAEFERLVSGHKIHYFISSGLGGSGDPAQITSWVRSHLKAETIGGMLVYNLAAAALAAWLAGGMPTARRAAAAPGGSEIRHPGLPPRLV